MVGVVQMRACGTCDCLSVCVCACGGGWRPHPNRFFGAGPVGQSSHVPSSFRRSSIGNLTVALVPVCVRVVSGGYGDRSNQWVDRTIDRSTGGSRPRTQGGDRCRAVQRWLVVSSHPIPTHFIPHTTGGLLAVASLVFLLLAIFMPGTHTHIHMTPSSTYSPLCLALHHTRRSLLRLPSHPLPTYKTQYTTGMEWFGVDKLVVFSDEAENSSLEVASSFHFGYLWAHQRIETEIDAVVFQEEGYGW